MELKAQIDLKVYEEHLGLMEIALEVDKITQGRKFGQKGIEKFQKVEIWHVKSSCDALCESVLRRNRQ